MRRHVLTLLHALSFCGVMTVTAAPLAAQSTTVVNLGTVTAAQVSDGLGFNIQPSQDWQWAAVAAAGGKHARIQCSWSTVEQQTAPPNNAQASTPYIEDPTCAAGLASAARYGIHPTVVAGYGAPFHQILNVTFPNGASAGSTSLYVEVAQGFGGDTLANVKFPYDYICPFQAGTGGRAAQCNGQITAKYAGAGSFITGIKIIDTTHAILTLASQLRETLPADGTLYMVNEILYPSTATQDPSDASINAYGNYVSFLAKDMADRGVTGDIEIWNEPPWKNDPWDYRAGMYDNGTYPGPSVVGANFGFVANLQHRTFPAGITATWNGTSGSGSASLLGSFMTQYTGEALLQPSTVVTKESFHPYGGQYSIPEGVLMDPNCLWAAAGSTSSWGKNIFANGRNCFLPGMPQNSNMMQAVELDYAAKLIDPSYGVGHSVTETNNLPPDAGYDIPQARSNVRQFLAFEAMGITPVEFYQLWDGSHGGRSFSFVDYDGTTFTPRQSYTAVAGLMSDVDGFSQKPVAAYTASTLPSVSSYSGTYPLMTTTVVGTRDGATDNSAALFVWQLTSCTNTNGCWYSVTLAEGGPVTVKIPSGMKVTAVRNVTTREDVSYTTNGSQITFAATDDPIEVMTDPTSVDPTDTGSFLQQTTLALTSSAASPSYGSQVALSAVLAPYNNKSNSTNGEKVSFYDNGTLLGSVPLSSGVASLDVTSLTVGTHVMSAAFGGDKNFSASSSKLTMKVTPATSTLTLASVADQTFGVPTVTVGASSTSTGMIHYSVSGPARVNTFTSTSVELIITGTGNVTVTANQDAVTGYAGASAQTSFTVNPATPTLTFRSVADRAYGSGAFGVKADSNSRGTITYSVVSGPATVVGGTVTIKGAGEVTLEASQAATANYTAVKTTTSFTITQATPQISMLYIQPKTFGVAPFNAIATSTSPATITYSIVSGPASVSGSTITLLGGGTVTVKASQAATTNYAAASYQESFTVNPGTPHFTLAGIPTQKYGATPVTLNPKTLSSGNITYKILTGPGKISGDKVSMTGSGYVVVQATQAATADYLAATAQVGFQVNAGSPNLILPTLANETTSSAPFAVNASSDSTAPITYKVVSGPAHMASNVVTVTGIGTIVVQASQPAQGMYTAATTTGTFLVVPTDADVQ